MAASLMLAATRCWAQRVQFPSIVADSSAATDAAPYSVMQPMSPPATPPPVATGPGGVMAAPTWDQYADPAQSAAPYSPYAPSPYAPPAGQPLYPEGLPPVASQGGFMDTITQQLRLVQEVRLRDTWLAGNGSKGLSVDDAEASATFAIPYLYNQAPFLITPGFAFHFFGGPKTVAPPPPQPDLPPRTYDAYLDFGWQPRVTDWLSFNVGARVGVYSDFQFFNHHSIRIMGRGLGIVTLTNEVQVALGVVYLDRNRVKLLPAGGVIWTPNPDARYEILFPNPKLAHRYTTIGTTEVWYYVSGEYGGGAWTIQRADGTHDDVDYNDIRVALGLESIALSGLRGMFEVGYVFDREIFYRSDFPRDFHPSNTVMLRAGVMF